MHEIVSLLALGAAIGVISGMLGIGGGVLLVPALLWLFGDLKPGQAAGITLAVLAVPVTLPGVWQYYQREVIENKHLWMAAWIACAFAVGTFLGAGVQGHVPAAALRIGFGLVMIYVAFRFILGANQDVAVAAAGVTSMSLAMAGYYWLRALGRRNIVRPELQKQIQAAQEQGRGDIEYHI